MTDRDFQDRIYIRDLSARCIIGFNPVERTDKQDVVINLELQTDLSAAAASDQVEDSVCYRTVKKAVYKRVEESRFQLLEALAGAIADCCLEFPAIQSVRVTVDKPGALRFARSVAVEIHRSR